MQQYAILFDLKTHVDPTLEDLWQELNFVPSLGMNIWLDEQHVALPEAIGPGAWFKVVDVDYQLKDNVFIVGLRELGQFDAEKQ